MDIKIVRNDNNVFLMDGSINGPSDWGISKIEGLETIKNEISTEKKAIGDGDAITAERVPSRDIDIIANAKDKNSNNTLREKAISFFNPKYNFDVYITNVNKKVWIRAKLESFKCPPKSKEAVELSLTLFCEDPYFSSVDNFGKNIASVNPMYHFPSISPIGSGFLCGVYNFAKQVQISNTGDADTYCHIVIKAKGSVINPKIIIGSSYVRVLKTLAENDVVDIDMVRNKITLNGVNCFRLLDRTSSFTDMIIKIGNNTVSFSADNGDTNMEVMVYYNLRYLGV